MDLWRENLKKMRERAGMTNSDLYRASGVSKSLISQMEGGTRPFTQKTLEDIANALGCTIYDFFNDESVQLFQPTPPKVAGSIAPADLRLLTEWVMEQEEPSRMAANIRFMVETRYQEFEQWIKKREENWERDTTPESKSVGGMK